MKLYTVYHYVKRGGLFFRSKSFDANVPLPKLGKNDRAYIECANWDDDGLNWWDGLNWVRNRPNNVADH